MLAKDNRRSWAGRKEYSPMQLLLISLFLHLLLSVSSTIALDVKILVPLWLTDFGSNVSYDTEAVRAEAAAFFLAVRHFNERRDDIVPELATVASCQKNLSIVRVCDESAHSRRVSAILKEFTGEYDVVVGMASMAAEAAAIAADVDEDKPLVSHWSSSYTLSDKTTYPLFSRTFISDGSYYKNFAKFVKQLGFSKLSILYVDDDTAPSSSKVLTDELVEVGVDALQFSYKYNDPRSIASALTRIKDTGRTVVAYLGYKTDLVDYVSVKASDLGLNTTEHLWIHSTADTLPTEEEINASPVLKDFMRGSLFLSFGTSDRAQLELFQSIVLNEIAAIPSFVNDVNTKLPPSGLATDTAGSCKNDALNISLPLGYFDDFSIEDLPDAFAAGYDAIMAVGLAACQDPSVTMPATGTAFAYLIRSMSFHGLSGLVEFDDYGDRREETTTFQLYNLRSMSSSSDVERVLSGSYNGSAWVLTNASVLETRGGLGLGSLPGDYLRPEQNFNYLPSGLIVLGYVEVAFGTLASIFCLTWMSLNLHEPVIRAAQPVFMTVAVAGCLSVVWAILPLTADDNVENGLQASGSRACMAIPYMFFLGMQVALGAVLGKTFRIYVMFERSSRYHQRFHVGQVFLLIVFMLGISLSLLIAWDVVAPFEFTRIIMVTDRFGQTVESRGECSFDGDGRSIGLLSTLAVVYGLSIIALRVLSTFAPKRFIEERNLAAALLQTFALLVPAALAAYVYVIGRFVILSSFFLLTALIILLFLFLPKYLAIREQRRWKAIVDSYSKDQESVPGSPASEINILDALRVPMVQTKFARYAEENYVTESYMFIVDVLAYKEQFESQSVTWRGDKASTIINVYIKAGSLLQVNVSEKCREQALALYRSQQASAGGLTESLFDDPLNEIATMLNHGAWASFVQEGGMYNVRPSLIPRSKILSLFTNDGAVRVGKSNNNVSSATDLAAAMSINPRRSGF